MISKELTTTKDETMKLKTVTIKGKKYYGSQNSDIWFEVEDLTKIGFITITGCGCENMYFTVTDDNGVTHGGYVKVF